MKYWCCFSNDFPIRFFENIYKCQNENLSYFLNACISQYVYSYHNIISENIISRQIVNSRIKIKYENDLIIKPKIKIIQQDLYSSENYF
jgi:hypothetical protein